MNGIRESIKVLLDSYDVIDEFNIIKSGSSRKYLKVKHKYCKKIYEIRYDSISNFKDKCPKCCGSYENSFAYHIEIELGLKLEDVWDFEKNTVNPYHISKNRNAKNKNGDNLKVWIKCQEKGYHGSYDISCGDFVRGYRCSYCASKKIHPLDSFGKYLEDNNMIYLWSNKNEINPYTISRSSAKKIWMLCDNIDYHNDNGGYEISCANFINGKRCSYCKSMYKVHIKDSFGYRYPNKAKCWHKDNDKSPYDVPVNSHMKYKFRCNECDCVWSAKIYNVSSNNTWCPKCSDSKGEKYISKWLKYNKVEYEYEKIFKGLVGLNLGDLRYDFYVPKYNLLIEYQGKQHIQYTPIFHDSYDDFERQLEHDKRKKEYAKNNNIKLLEIWYYDFDNIDSILRNELNKGDV